MGGKAKETGLVVPSSLYATSSYGGIGEVGYRIRKSLIAFLVLFQKSMKSDSVTSTIFGSHIRRIFITSS